MSTEKTTSPKAARMAKSYLSELFEGFDGGEAIKGHVIKTAHHMEYLPQKDHLVVFFDLSVVEEVPVTTEVPGQLSLDDATAPARESGGAA